jgi:hypothetical protein
MRARGTSGIEPVRSAIALAIGALVLLACAMPLSLASASALPSGKGWKPGKNKVYHGVSDTGSVADFRQFRRQVKAKPALLQMFFHWDVPLRSSGALHRWWATKTRGVLSLSTERGDGTELLTPRQIAQGHGDHYILRLNQTIANAAPQTVYIRFLPEMNGHWNPYSAFNPDGTRRGGGRGTLWFQRAWRRFATIVRGGPRDAINRHLVRNKMPRIHRAGGLNDPVYGERRVPRELPQPRVALMWVPQTFGSPNIRGNQPIDYWPGRRYVDWIGADIYSRWASEGVWASLERFFRNRRWRGKPFVIGEYSPYDNDHAGDFVRRLFRWERQRNRVKMLLYYRSVNTHNPHNIQFYRGARRSLRGILKRKRYIRFAPGVRRLPEEPPPSPPQPPPPDPPSSGGVGASSEAPRRAQGVP